MARSNNFPDVGEIVRSRALIARTNRENQLQPSRLKSAEQTNTLNAFNIRKAERGERAEAATADIQQRIRAGDPNAFKELAIQNPAAMTKTIAALAAKRKLDTDTFNNGALAIMRAAVAGAQNPPDWPRLRSAVMRQHPGITDKDIPEKLSNEFVKSAIAFGSGVAALQKQTGFGQGNQFLDVGVPGQPGATQKRRVPVAGPAANIGPPKLPAIKAAKGGNALKRGEGPGELKAADTNALKAIINDRIGEFFDPTSGEIKVLDPTRKALALAVLTEASRILSAGGVTHADAVTQAARKLDIQITEPATEGPGRKRQSGVNPDIRQKQLKAFSEFVNRQP